MTEIIMSQTPPILHGPSEKEKKYDRQLRLWAASGQAALESAHIILINSGSGTVGIETLKNLILPGIGKFTVVDDAIVDEADLGVNFFLDESSIGKPRAQCATEFLQELNPEVESNWLPKDGEAADIGQVLADYPTSTLILYTLPIKPQDLTELQAFGRKASTPLIAIHSAGFYSYFRIDLPGAFPIVDTHPDVTATVDLRVVKPWPELLAFAKDMTSDLEELSNHEHGHIPYIVLLLHYLEKWKQDHGGTYPSNHKEKTEFRNIVSMGARTDNPEGGEENFDEAVSAVMRAVTEPLLSSSVREVFDHQPSNKIETDSGFWIIADAVKTFYGKHKCLPLPGSIPDMKAQSDIYIKLQSIYQAKARSDVQEVLDLVKSVPGGQDVDPAEVEMFCKNAAFIKLIDPAGGGESNLSKTAAEELENDANNEAIMASMDDPAVKIDLSLLPIYLALSATAHNPSATVDEILSTISSAVPNAADNLRLVQAAEEVARARGGELHNISALTGGMVAQEAIKIITKQYVPADNTCIFDGIGSRCQVLRL